MIPFTVNAAEAAERRVARDLEIIAEAVRGPGADDELLALILLGGYARGEGVVVTGTDGTLRGFNDYDLLLLFAREPRDRNIYGRLSQELARRLEIDFVDLGLATAHQVVHAPKTLFWYELGEAHRVLWQKPGASVPPLPRFSAADIDPAEGSLLLQNRGLALLWAGDLLWPEGAPAPGAVPAGDSDALRFAAIAAHKSILAAGDAALLRSGNYSHRQEERVAALTATPAWAEDSFLARYREAAAFRRRPEIPPSQQVARLWWEARTHHEAGMKAAEAHRLGVSFASWPEHAELVQREQKEQQRSAGHLLRTVKRSLTGADAPPDPFLWLTEMTRLLYADPGRDPSWKEQVQALVKRWHP